MMRMPYQTKPTQDISRQALCKADYTFSSPFSLSLEDQEYPLICTESVRIIPGKRLVAFGHWGKRPVVAKIFFSKHAKKHMQRDMDGTLALIRAKIPTPALYYSGLASNPEIYVLLYERIMNAQSLEEFWQQNKNTPAAEAILKELTIELATQHVLGLLQHDLHLNNFLVAQDNIYTLDGADIQCFPTLVGKKQSIQNLALFFSQLGIHGGPLHKMLFHTYVNVRSWLVKDADRRHLENTLQRWDITRWSHFRKKIFRSSTQFAKINQLSKHIIYNRHYCTPEFEAFLLNPKPCFTQPETAILKAGRTSTVAKISLGQQTFVVKRYNNKNVVHQLSKLFKPSRARLSWRVAHQLQFAGLNTAKPIALIEQLTGTSYLVMEYVTGIRADHFFTTITDQTQPVAEKIIALFFNLASLQLSHGDLKITNILINEKLEPVLIDLDSMRTHRSALTLRHRFNKDMQRFLENWHERPELHQLFKQLIEEQTE